MYFNTMINQVYWNVWRKLASVKDTCKEEVGAEAVEWLVLVAVLVMLLMGLWMVVGNQRTIIAENVVCGVKSWINDAFGSSKSFGDSFAEKRCA